MTAYEALSKIYELEASLRELETRCEQLQADLPMLKHRKREEEVAALEAESSLRRFFDRLSGKAEEAREAQARAVRAAAAALDTAQRELAVLNEKRNALHSEYENLGDKASLMVQLSSEEQTHFLHLESGILAEATLYYLAEVRKKLHLAQELARDPMMTIDGGHQKNVHLSDAGKWADRCRENLEKIATCGIDLPIHPYIQQPMGYLVTAQRYGGLDRMNSALDGIRETESSLKELLLQLVEE